MTEMPRTSWVDYAKGIGIVLVVYGHVVGGGIASSMQLPGFFPVSRDVIYRFHMPLFFFLSGMFVEKSWSRAGGQAFLGRKLRRIAYPYVVWSLLQGTVVLLLSRHSALHAGFSDLLAIGYRPLHHFWFLYVLLLMYMIYAGGRTMMTSVAPVLAVVAVLLIYSPASTAIAGMDYFSANLIYFVAGILYQQHELDGHISGPALLPLGALSLAIFAAVQIAPAGSMPDKFAAFLVACAGILFVSIVAKYLARKDLCVALQTAGSCSMPIYLAHGFSGSGARIVLHDVLRIEAGGTVIVLATILGVAVPMMLYRYSMLYFPYLFELPDHDSNRRLASGTGTGMP